MDLDADGHADVLTGSYLPGEVLCFAGIGGGRFAAPRALADAAGTPLVAGRASWPRAADWDRDGDLDLVIGNMYGKVFLARNASGDRRLQLAQPVPLEVGGEPLAVVPTNAAPCLADWDGDGAADLVLGLGDGSVLLYRDTRTRGEPELARPIVLVEPAPGGSPAERLARPAQRARPAVTDWNSDGRMDLVIGDHASEDGPAPVLDEAQRRELDAAIRAGVELGERRAELENAAFERWLAARSIPPGDGHLHRDAFLVEWLETEEGRELTGRQAELAEVQRRLSGEQIDHGRVWVFLRRAP